MQKMTMRLIVNLLNGMITHLEAITECMLQIQYKFLESILECGMIHTLMLLRSTTWEKELLF